MDIPTPKPGQVIRYAYLWADEHDQGKEEGSKDRPVAIILATVARHNNLSVAVLPITHTPPSDSTEALEIPPDTKRRLNLDNDRSWVILNELYMFAWPGPDIRSVPASDPATILYGMLPANFVREIRDRVIVLQKAKALRPVSRTE